MSNSSELDTKTFCLGATSVKIPRGIGDGRVSNYNTFDIECVGIIYIKNKDHLCHARALVVAKAYVDNDPDKRKLCEFMGVQTCRTLECLDKIDVEIPIEGSGISQLKKFQEYLVDYTIRVCEYGNKGRYVLFEVLRAQTGTAPILACPDFSRTFTLQCDVSLVGLGYILTQEFDDGEHVIAYASRALTTQGAKFSATELECLAVLLGIQEFRCYVEGIKFNVISDQSSLLWLHKLQNPSGRLARWSLKLQGYDFDIFHRKGHMNVVPDALSRAVSFVDVAVEDQDL
ncbi:hypothetical protein JTB14_010233 [Gonioctena quinquepunctata]|nr:hypothetical protein JTB14_010233 [Gonioctena quinquepunctata]